MQRPPVPLGRLVSVTAVLALPMAAALALLVLAGALKTGPALLAFAGAALGFGLLVRFVLSDIEALQLWVRTLAAGEDGRWPRGRASGLLDPVFSGMAQMQRALSRREDAAGRAAGSLETMLDGVPDPLLMLADSRKVTRANSAARKMFGRQLVGRDLAGVLREPSLLDASDQVIRGDAPAADLQFSLPVPLDLELRARIQRLPEEAADGTRALLALHDVTALKRMEQMRADFVANASHELRTPLSAVLGYIETLRGPAADDPEAQVRFLGIMHEQSARMARLVDDLLSLSRIELNEHTLPTGTTDLARVLESVAETLEMAAGAKDMEIRLDLPPDMPPITGDPDQLAQVFQNLVDNAVKYGRAGTTVEVGAIVLAKAPPALSRAGRGAVRVWVRDHGEGIEREHIPRLTERFYRVDSARSRKLGGTGLGLAIVKHLISRHRGALSIDSRPGKGSTFTVTLPVEPG